MSADLTDATAAPQTPAGATGQPAKLAPTGQQRSQPGVPKKITNAQTVCNEKNEKGKLCNGHLKQLRSGGEEAEEHLRGDDVLFKCQTCGTLYMGPPLGHVRDPDKQSRFVERELAALLRAAGGTLPVIKKNEKGVYVLAEPPGHGAPAQAKPAPAAAKPAAPVAARPAPAAGGAPAGEETPEQKKARLAAEAGARKAMNEALGPIPGASGPVPGETPQQKIARLKAVVAEAKRRKELMASGAFSAPAAPAAAPTAGTDSSAQADAHRPAAEAQAATGQASAVPLSPAAATASPASGAETVADLAPDASTEKTPGAPPAAHEAAAKPAPAVPSGPVPGETHEQKIARLKAVVAAAKERAEREGRAKKPPKA